MKIRGSLLILFLILVVASFLRLWQLGENPPSINWDEASLGYNAYSILKTGADEYGSFLPTAIRSFNDYKPAAYVYLTIPSILIFGLNEFSVRLPSAVLGILTVLFTFLLVKELFNSIVDKQKKQYGEKVALLSAALLAISPWHLQFSRAAFEANIGLFFFVAAAFFFIKGLRNSRYLILSFIVFALTFYTYHSFRLIVPFFGLGLLIYFRKEIWIKRKETVLGIVLAAIVTIPLVIGLFTNLSRFSSVTIFTSYGLLDESIKKLEVDKERGDLLGQMFHNRRVVYTMSAIEGYLDHFDPVFLFIRGDSVERHHAIGFGMLYLIELPFVLLGILNLFFMKGKARFVVFLWFLLAPLAAALTTGTPHAIRALPFLPAYQIFTAIGIVTFLKWLPFLKFKPLNISLYYPISGFIIFLFIFNFLYYLNLYYVHTPLEASKNWQYGYRQAIEYAKENEHKYDRIVITYRYDQPYIYYLFFNKIDPSWYQKNWDYNNDGEIERMTRIIGKYEFRNIDYKVDKELGNTLLIGTPDEIPQDASIKEINFLDGNVAFRASGS
jgi:4-amino-4-deoxy-L-arabinose transferase-like glycosyltransferase